MIEASITPAATPQVEAIEREFSRLYAARPHLQSRIKRAEQIIVTQFSVPKSVRPVKVHIHPGGSRSFSVTSCSSFMKTYTVTESFTCNCPDAKRRQNGVKPPACKHGIAAYVLDRALLRPTPPVSPKTSPCSGCGDRVPGRELTEVQDWHESLSYFEGDMLCVDCFASSDCW